MIEEINLKEITDSLFTDIQNSLIEKAMKEFAEIKCRALLEIVSKKADEAHVGGWDLDRDEVLNSVNLKQFIDK